MKTLKQVFLIPLMILGLFACNDNSASSGPADESLAQASASHFPQDEVILDILRQRIEENRGVGYVLGMIDANGDTRIVSHGSAGPDAMPLTADSIFEIGSITKTFTGMLLADMVIRGEVRLDQPVEELLPEGVSMPQRNGRQITLLDLATHTSGLPRLPDNMPMSDPTNPYADYSEEMMFEFLNGYELTRDIGSQLAYSNLAVGLLGHALGRVHGGGYGAALQERLLQPLGMASTGMEFSPDMLKRAVKGHDQGGQVTPFWDLPTLAGAIAGSL
jgi:D-alanyl-D-alanine-carboxypeptidase/D-alanyl-D-alanine-endopeptidase